MRLPVSGFWEKWAIVLGFSMVLLVGTALAARDYFRGRDPVRVTLVNRTDGFRLNVMLGKRLLGSVPAGESRMFELVATDGGKTGIAKIHVNAITATPSATPIPVVQKVRSAVDDVGQLEFTADPAYFTQLGSITIKFSGTAVPSSSTPFSVSLKSLNGTTAQTCTPGAGNSCSVTFTPTFSVSANTCKTFKVRIDSTNFYDAPGMLESLSVTIENPGDITWSDGVTNNIPLEIPKLPIVIAQIQYL